jgi:hypothetical protein
VSGSDVTYRVLPLLRFQNLDNALIAPRDCATKLLARLFRQNISDNPVDFGAV